MELESKGDISYSRRLTKSEWVERNRRSLAHFQSRINSEDLRWAQFAIDIKEFIEDDESKYHPEVLSLIYLSNLTHKNLHH